ncbi:acyltransferase family protein [Pseudoxanthomonas sp. UTMC 1351]|uniref:acyltransferase family protein n=1 Tax=Pseudoxanthomonas sp. UTMC 1351 TaxID=2695853 RepID=UPI0034CD03FC
MANYNSPPMRFNSVDTLRGITVAAMLLVNNPGDWGHVYWPLLHAQWHGITPTDLIFPFFLFIVGVSIALGIVPRVETGADPATLRRTIWIRAAKIIGLGLLLHLLAFWLLDKPWFRPWGVLQRIGLCFAVAGMAALYVRPRAQWIFIAVALLGYWALLAVSGGYVPLTNLASRIDAALLGPMAYQFDAATGRGHEPEGLLSTLPAIATTLLGLRAGEWLRHAQLWRLLVIGVALSVMGWLWAPLFPINKNLWTSSYVLLTGGCAMLALALSHVLIDRYRWPAWGRSFGVNAIAAYAGSAAMVLLFAGLGWWEPIYRVGFANWMTPLFGPYLPSLAFALTFVLFWWGVVRWMDRHRWYLKV